MYSRPDFLLDLIIFVFDQAILNIPNILTLSLQDLKVLITSIHINLFSSLPSSFFLIFISFEWDFEVIAAFLGQFEAVFIVLQSFTSKFTFFAFSIRLICEFFTLIDGNFCIVWLIAISLDLHYQTVPGQNYLFNCFCFCIVLIFVATFRKFQPFYFVLTFWQLSQFSFMISISNIYLNDP